MISRRSCEDEERWALRFLRREEVTSRHAQAAQIVRLDLTILALPRLYFILVALSTAKEVFQKFVDTALLQFPARRSAPSRLLRQRGSMPTLTFHLGLFVYSSQSTTLFHSFPVCTSPSSVKTPQVSELDSSVGSFRK